MNDSRIGSTDGADGVAASRVLRILEVQPDEEIVRELTSLLEQARSGTLRGLAYVTIDSERLNQYGVVGAEARSNTPRVHFLLHWLATLIIESWMQRGREDHR
jgi:hypothetical protein